MQTKTKMTMLALNAHQRFGRLLVVVNRPHPTVDILQEQLGAVVRGGERDGYFVLEARWS